MFGGFQFEEYETTFKLKVSSFWTNVLLDQIYVLQLKIKHTLRSIGET